MNLSGLIHKISKRHKIPSKIYSAILMQESGYRLDAVSKECGFREVASEHDFIYFNKGGTGCVYTDFGIAQIHYKSVLSHEFEAARLLEDLEYSLNAGAQILSYFYKRYSKKEPARWFCRYNVGTRPASQIQTACTTYIDAVKRWM